MTSYHLLRSLNNVRSMKKYLLKFFFCTIPLLTLIIVVLSWQFHAKVHHLKELRENWRKEIEKMAKKTNNTWRLPDVQGAAIFSAYLDSRPEVALEEIPFWSSLDHPWALIRIIGILDVDTKIPSLRCYYKYTDRSTISERPAIGVRFIASIENFGMRYSAAFVICELVTTSDGSLPSQVTFSSNRGRSAEELGDFVDIRYTAPPVTRPSFMAACVPSLHHGYANHAGLVEFVEFYRSMGVDRFTFYNASVSPRVSRVLEWYARKNLASVVQWKLPGVYKFERNLRYNGIFAALNDCLYRNMYTFTYVVNVDLDEFIIPRKQENFRQMMDYLDPNSDLSSRAAFVFRNVFFYLMYDDDPDWPKLTLESKTTRFEEIYEAHSRSKYIARSENVIEMGNHQIWRSRKTSFLFRAGETTVDPDTALSHHYRFCEVNELVCWLRKTTVDRAAHKYTKVLRPRVAAVLRKVFGNERV
ncbi:beta-1,4-galactosyltransferase galt-1-like isoform X2 [Copidosoma floridanum]|uniref:beta-1,4-galactosyltransferase galt-1-like isoform X2 n=1 Tax=Copidosoma floridanum TaxID=29053 RepID=UPI000C6FAF96|nr:beta-1,4-galactosyltransferase galt-1-like isoform X2 [Copidosoma floridanum]